MNRDDITRMAREAGADRNSDFSDWSFEDKDLERFFHMAQAAEREACAKTIDEMHLYGFDDVREFEIATLQDAAKAIRARSQNDGH